MSNVGKKIIFVPKLIQVIQKQNFLIFYNTEKKIFLKVKINVPINLNLKEKNKLLLSLDLSVKNFSKQNILLFKQMFGTLRSQIKNTVLGLYKMHSIKLKFVGVGYRATLKKNILILRLGFSHKLFYKLAKEVEVLKIKKRPPVFLLKSIDLDIIKSTAFMLRSFKKPEPYKGKGIVLINEYLKLKEGKKTKNN